MNVFMKNFNSIYTAFIENFYLCFLFLVITFGRGFSIVHIPSKPFPLFITEIFLLISFPYLLLQIKNIKFLPKAFLIPLLVFITYGLCHLSSGLILGNFYALRDIVLCVYLAFFFLTYAFICYKPENLRRVVIVFLGGNLCSIFLGRFFISSGLEETALVSLSRFLFSMRSSNFGLAYGLGLVFILYAQHFFKTKTAKIFASIWFSINAYMLFVIGGRTYWLALISLIVFYVFVSKKKHMKFLAFCIPFIVCIFTMLVYLDFHVSRIASAEHVELKLMDVFKRPAKLKKVDTVKCVRKQGSNISEPRKVVTTKKMIVEPKKKVACDIIQPHASVHWRKKVWEQAIQFGLKTPFLGRGFGNYPVYVVWNNSPERISTNIFINSKIIPAHNHLITIFYKMGFLGLSLFIYLNAYVFVFGLCYIQKCQEERYRLLLISSLSFFVFWHVSALFFDVINSPPTSVFLWIIMGLIFAIVRRDQGIG